MPSNTAMSGNTILRQGLKLLRERLPLGWRLEPAGTGVGKATTDSELRLVDPERRSARLRFEVKSALTPRAAIELISRRVAKQGTEVLLAPFLSPAVRDRLRASGVFYLDLTGNVYLVVSRPGLFIETTGADANPARSPDVARTLRGATAGRIVRALLETSQPPGVRKLAAQTQANPGYVSRLLAWMDREALLERRGRGQLVSVDWQRLLRRWAEESSLATRGRNTHCLAARGLPDLLRRLGRYRESYAVTGSLAASTVAPVAPAKLAMVYLDQPEEALAALDLRVAEAGANVVLIEPVDQAVYAGARRVEGVMYVALSQAAADLLSSPGRGPSEAEALITWMAEHEALWRG
ncbi:MAG: hypothetical protein ACT4PU_05460 [Planctomycetota bacterium]